MNKTPESSNDSQIADDLEMAEEYDFSKAVRGHRSQAVQPINVRIDDRSVTIKTIEVEAIVSEDRKVMIQLPADIAPGQHRIVLMIEEAIAAVE